MKNINFTCPFCSLLCDDIQLETKNNNFKSLNSKCPILINSLKREINEQFSRINGEKTNISQAIEELSFLIKKSKSTLFAGMGTDIKGTKAMLKIADKFKCIIDHYSGDNYVKNIKSIQEVGGFFLTLSELKNRSDTIIIIQSSDDKLPRLFERYIFSKETINNLKKRKVVFIGNKVPKFLHKNKKKLNFDHIKLNSINLLNFISSLRNSINSEISEIKDKKIVHLLQLLKQTNYGSILWSMKELDNNISDLIVTEINLLIQDLNKFTRFAGLSLSGSDHILTVNEVLLWQTGFPIRTSFEKGFPVHNINQFSTKRLIDNKEIELVIWINSYNEKKIIINKNIKTVLIGIPSHPQKKDVDVFIPVGTPGLDHNSHLLRIDKVVSLPLKKIRNISLPSVDFVLNKVGQI
jgi:formylmethanofuran dehydrogenase subunit B